MVASAKTIDNVVKILLKRLGREKALAIFGELRQAKGNKSFTETIRLVYERLMAHD
tara:strand:+ start:136 stop:303 length:168 start_codon:yes stop_codon:yes gene_type:complete